MERRCVLVVGVVFAIVLVQYFLLYGKLLIQSVKSVKQLSLSNDYRDSISTVANVVKTGSSQKKEKIWNDLPSRLTEEQQKTLKEKLQQASRKTKYVLNWYGKHRKDDRPWPNNTCGRCVFTNDQTMITHPDTGAVVFMYNQFSSSTLPKTPRRRDQLHIWFTGEAPSSLYTARRMFLALEDRYKFNLTQNYRRDSSIYHPYGLMSDILRTKWENGEHENISAILREKTKVAVAVVSNCKVTAGAKVRLQAIQKMKELGLEIDTFGACFEQTVNETHHEFERLLTRYKFYLAFENAYHCRDYITEKFYINGFRAGSVPVALGAKKEDYEAVAPADSFIFAEDFRSIRSLVSYLNYLNRNDEAYLKYFRWIGRGLSALPMQGRVSRFCQVCRQIHGINVDDVYHPYYNSSNAQRPIFTDYIAERTVGELRKWYYNTEDRDCFERVPDRIKRLLNFSDFLPNKV